MKRFIAVLLSATTIFTCSTSVFANEEKSVEITQSMEIKNAKKNRIQSPKQVLADNTKKVFVNGKQIELSEGSIVYEGRVFLPVRDLSEALDLDLFYNDKEKVVVVSSLKGNKIQLPVNENKAVVNDKIVSIDKENNKVGTIIVKDKTYLPLRFISENFGYSIEYNSSNGEINIKKEMENTTQEQTEEGVVKLDKNKAVEAYKQINDQLQNLKNYTTDTNGKIDFMMSDKDTNLKFKMDLTGTGSFDLKEKPNMYMEQKINMELMDMKESIQQKMFYKDGKMYVDQNGIKYKMDLGLEQAMDMSNSLKIDDTLTEEIVIGGSVKDLDNGNKQYSFDLDMSKVMDILEQFSKELQLKEEDLKVLKTLNIKNTNFKIDLDNKNQPIMNKIVMDMGLNVEGINVQLNIDIDMKYRDIGSSVVNPITEDLNSYKDFNEVVKEMDK